MMAWLALALSPVVVAAPAHDFQWLSTTPWYVDTDPWCRDAFGFTSTEGVSGQVYTLEVGVLLRDDQVVEHVDVLSADGAEAYIGLSPVVLWPADCVRGSCGPQDDYPAADGYQWWFYRSELIKSVEGELQADLLLQTHIDLGEDAVGSDLAMYVASDADDLYGIDTTPAFTLFTLEPPPVDGDPNAALDIDVSGGTTNAVRHGCSNTTGPIGWSWLWLLGFGLRRPAPAKP